MPMRILPLLLALTPAVTGQRTIIVQGGPEALNDAFRMVDHEDTVLVRPGTYHVDAPIRHGITVVFDTGVTLVPTAFRGFGLSVHRIPAGRTVRIVGGAIFSVDVNPPVGIAENAGSVVFDGFTTDRVHVFDSSAVSFHDCSLGQLLASSSRIALSACSLRGRATGPTETYAESAAIWVRNVAEVIVTGGSIRGGDNPSSAVHRASPAIYVSPTFANVPSITMERRIP